MDFGAVPPEMTSALIYAGPGSGPMVAAAAAWNGLAAELQSAAASFGSVISELATEWLGSSAAAMVAALTPFVAWLNGTAALVQHTATQAQAAAAAFEAAFAMTVSPAVIAANRAELAVLVATNVFGQNTPAIAANQAHYSEMWAQDALAMYSYAANSASAARLTQFTAAPQTTNPAGQASQSAAVAQVTATSTGTGVQSALSQLTTLIPSALQGLASPTSAASAVSGLLGDLTSASSGFSTGGFAESLISEGLDLLGFAAIFGGFDTVGPLLTAYAPPLAQATLAPMTAVGAAGEAAEPVAEGAAGAAAEGVMGSGFAEGLGGWAGLGQAGAVGGLSVPPSWGWAAASPSALLGGLPLASPLVSAESAFGAGLGWPMVFGGLPRAAGTAAAAGVGAAAAVKYGPRLNVVARPAAAGYSPTPVSPPIPAYPVTAGHPPPVPGYTPAIVYLPTNGHAPAKV